MATALMREFLTWLSVRPRTYDETMEAWRTSCARHTVWEDAIAEGLVELQSSPGGFGKVLVTVRGKALLSEIRSD